MLLETLDIKKNDILIYSQNMFDLENNFKIIYKDDPVKVSKKISYGEVCRYINEFTPKNLIVYRLLTNIPDFEIFLSKYGFFVNINSETELIYFDPVFAVKELEEYSANLNYDLRFRIQQVGLTTLNRHGSLPNYAEIYSADMQALEAKNQNDKVFAEAIFSMEQEVKKAIPVQQAVRKSTVKNTVLNPELQRLKKEIHPAPVKKAAPAAKDTSAEKPAHRQQSPENNSKPKVRIVDDSEPALRDEIRFIQHDLSEDKDFDYKQIIKINLKNGAAEREKRNKERFSIQDAPPDTASLKAPSPFGKFLQAKQISGNSNEHISLGDIPNEKVIGIFKSPSSLKDIAEGKENKKVILKLD
jgi:hypothetical protein